MQNQFSRTQLIFGSENMERLKNARVAVFGVGGYTVEALARSGIGTLDLIDDDRVCLTNINRQILATRKTVGQYKVDVAKERILEINPDATVNTYKTFYIPDTKEMFNFADYDYVVDAIDTVTGKIQMVLQAQECGTPIVSSMGAGNKTNQAAGRYVHKLQGALHMSGRNSKKMYSAPGYSRKQCLCSVSCRTNCGRRSSKRYFGIL